jgi:hypothetical protein
MLLIDLRQDTSPTVQIIDSDDGNAERTLMSYLNRFPQFLSLFLSICSICHVVLCSKMTSSSEENSVGTCQRQLSNN